MLQNSAERLNVDMVHYFAGVQDLPQDQEANDVAKNSAERLNVDMVHCFAGVQDHAQSIKKDAVVAWQEKCVVALAQFTAVYILNQHRNQEFVVKH
jgi:hypothetical protein